MFIVIFAFILAQNGVIYNALALKARKKPVTIKKRALCFNYFLLKNLLNSNLLFFLIIRFEFHHFQCILIRHLFSILF